MLRGGGGEKEKATQTYMLPTHVARLICMFLVKKYEHESKQFGTSTCSFLIVFAPSFLN